MAIIEKPLPGHANIKFMVTEQPAIEPITVAQVKEYAKIETDAEDDYIESLIVAIRQIAEGWLGRALIEQEITAYMDYWPNNPIKLPRPRLMYVSSVSTIDEENNVTEYSVDNYFYQSEIEPGCIIVKNGSSPPTNTDRQHGGYRIIYQAGYGDLATDVPQAIKTGLKEWVLFAIESRTVDREPPEMAKALLGAYRIFKI